jgi:hypothetical protein
LLETNIWAIETRPILVTINLVVTEKIQSPYLVVTEKKTQLAQGMTTKIIFSCRKVWGSNFFNGQTLWQPKFSMTNLMTIQNFQILVLRQLKTF